MQIRKSLFVVTLLVASLGFSALAAGTPITDHTVVYIDFSGPEGQAIESVWDEVSGLEAMAVQVAPTRLVYGPVNPFTQRGSAFFENPNTGNGDGSYLYIADHPVIDFADLNALTLEMFVRPESIKLAVLLRKTQPGGEDGYLLTMDAEGRLIFQMQSPYERKQIRTGPGALREGEWAHVAATWDGHDMRIYVNGEEMASGTFVDILDGTDGHLGIGALVRNVQRNSWGQIFHGYMSQIRISNTALDPADFLLP